MSAPTYLAGGYKNITATTQVSTQGSTILGVLVATTTAGTLQFYDSATGTTTTPMTGVLTLSAGTFLPLYMSAGTGIYVVVGGTINATVVYA
jgi:hypothetical protein